MNSGQSLLQQAIWLATKAHYSQEDKSGNPYILHPLRVMQAVGAEVLTPGYSREEEMAAAVLHDVVEDSKYSLGDMTAQFGTKVAVVVDCLSRRKREKESYDSYLDRIAENLLAVKVKLADLWDNLGRLGNLSEADQARLRPKYEAAIKRLSHVSDREPTEEEKKTGMELAAMAQECLERNKLSQPAAPRTQGREPAEVLVRKLIKAAVELGLLRHITPLIEDEDDDLDIDFIAADTANACFGIGTCTEERIPELTAVLSLAQARTQLVPKCPECGADISGSSYVLTVKCPSCKELFPVNGPADFAQFFTALPEATKERN